MEKLRFDLTSTEQTSKFNARGSSKDALDICVGVVRSPIADEMWLTVIRTYTQSTVETLAQWHCQLPLLRVKLLN